MQRSWKFILAGILALTVSTRQAWACGGNCRRPTGGGGRYVRPPQGEALPTPIGVAAGGEVINDLLPADAKIAIRMAAKEAQGASSQGKGGNSNRRGQR